MFMQTCSTQHRGAIMKRRSNVLKREERQDDEEAGENESVEASQYKLKSLFGSLLVIAKAVMDQIFDKVSAIPFAIR